MHGHLRDGVPLRPALHRQRLDDGQRERDRQPPGGALAEGRVDVDRAADPLDVGLHHVHADTAAGHVGDRLRRGEAGPEQQRQQLPAVHPGQLVAGDQAAVQRGGGDPVRVDAGAVVGHLDDDVPALVVGAQGERALRVLADLQPGGGPLDPVVDRIAHQVRQRVLHRLQQAAVQLGLPADLGEPHLLAAGATQVTDDPGQLRPEVFDRLHARLHDALLQLAGDQVRAAGWSG